MPIYFGKSADGSDAQEFKGFHVSPCGNFWGSSPFYAKKAKNEDWKRRIKSLQRN